MSNSIKLSLFLLGTAFLISPLGANFTRGFYKFLKSEYGDYGDTLFNGGGGGSFGGGDSSHGIRTRFRPVVMVHGLGGTALPYFGIYNYLGPNSSKVHSNDITAFRNRYLQDGYKSSELYATSYSISEVNSQLMPCERVRRFYTLIKAVHAYTGSLVDVAGYSLGGVVGRKAVLGGRCVDTGEDLGPPLTNIVHTFLSVAGPQRGGGGICPGVPECCDDIIGLPCNSSFLADINNPERAPHYEGKVVYTIYSKDDDLVKYDVCDGQIACEIPGEDLAHVKHNLTHGGVLAETYDLQYLLLTHDQEGYSQSD